MSHIPRSHLQKCRTAWLSDTHLGYRGSKTAFLLDFLEHVECEYLYLVGDIIDIEHMQEKGVYWPESHNNVIEAIINKAKNNTQVFYIPGNHDAMLRKYDGCKVSHIEIHNQCIHQTVDGRKLLMMHGDEFDPALKHHPLISFIGDKSNNFILYLNRHLHALHSKLGLPYCSYSATIKRKVKQLVNLTATIQAAALEEAQKFGVDGIVCGHQHQAQIKDLNGTLYCNDGDWVESCTTMVEHHDGTLELLRWREKVTSLAVHPPRYSTVPQAPDNAPEIPGVQAA